MPVLELGNIWGSHESYRAQIAVRSIMKWPNDASARKKYLAALMAQHLGELQLSAKDLPDPAEAGDWFESIATIELMVAWMQAKNKVSLWFEEGGGFMAVANAPPLQDYQSQMTAQVPAWFAAGLILALIRRMATHHPDLPGGASVNKAVFILERVPLPWVPHNSHDLRRAWTTYKPVCQFCAALFDFFMQAMLAGGDEQTITAEIERKLQEEFVLFLAEADAYQQFGLAYSPPRTKGRPILDPNEAWLLSEEKQWAPTLRDPAPLDGPLLESSPRLPSSRPWRLTTERQSLTR